jgi:hypothetical protein
MDSPKKPSITQFAAALREARANGSASQLRAVPAAVEQMMLTTALAEVDSIEKSLAAARSNARTAARRDGVSLSNLFGKTQFIARSTGERWRDEALEQGKAERDALFLRVAAAVANPDPRFAAVSRAMREGMARGAFNVILGETTSTTDDPDAAEAAEQARIEAEAKERAEAILAAAALRDAGGPPLPKPGPKAQRILDVARAAHRKVGDDD